jgi:4-amino-4-deoxy-L-arabinose transferase-like glycosyltransferase
MLNKTLDSVILFCASLFLFTWGLSSQEIIGFESRFYLFALEMWRHGASWFPTTYQQPYPDYPATSTYLIYLASLLFGHLNKFTAVLPSAIASAATLSVTYLIGASYQRKWGWCAAFFLLFTAMFVAEARTISLDQYVTLITVLSFYLLISMDLSSGSTKENKKFVALISFLLILGFAFRGPIGIVIPTGVMCVSCLLDKQFKRFFIIGFLAAFLLVLCSAVLMGLAYHAGGASFVQDVLRMEVVGRMGDVSILPVYFYFKESFGTYALAYPLAILVIAGCLPYLYKSNASPEIQLIRKCLGWALVVIIGLSIPSDKKMRYILPFVPALALICGYLFVNAKQNRYSFSLYRATYVICFIFPLAALSILAIIYKKQPSLELNYPVLITLLLLLQMLIVGFRKKSTVVLGLAALTFVIAHVFIIETINLKINRTHDFVSQIESLREKEKTPLVFFQEGSDGLPIKYLVSVVRETLPTYLYQSDELLSLKPHTFVIVREENVIRISQEAMKHFHIIQHGQIGHNNVLVLEKE